MVCLRDGFYDMTNGETSQMFSPVWEETLKKKIDSEAEVKTHFGTRDLMRKNIPLLQKSDIVN